MFQRIGVGRSPSMHLARWSWPSGHGKRLAPSGLRSAGAGNLLRGLVHRRGQFLVVVGALLGGPHRGCPRPDRGGHPDQHGGGGACTRVGTRGEPTKQPTPSIPGGEFRRSGEWQRFRSWPACRVGGPTRQAAWQRLQGRRRRPGQTRQGQGQEPDGAQLVHAKTWTTHTLIADGPANGVWPQPGCTRAAGCHRGGGTARVGS
jgi:hypothetical protein